MISAAAASDQYVLQTRGCLGCLENLFIFPVNKSPVHCQEQTCTVNGTPTVQVCVGFSLFLWKAPDPINHLHAALTFTGVLGQAAYGTPDERTYFGICHCHVPLTLTHFCNEWHCHVPRRQVPSCTILLNQCAKFWCHFVPLTFILLS